MKVIVFGATGKTGLHVCRQALEQGHQVTAFTRSVSKIDGLAPDLQVAQGEVTDDYTADNTGKVRHINRADLAHQELRQVDDAAYSKQAISVTS